MFYLSLLFNSKRVKTINNHLKINQSSLQYCHPSMAKSTGIKFYKLRNIVGSSKKTYKVLNISSKRNSTLQFLLSKLMNKQIRLHRAELSYQQLSQTIRVWLSRLDSSQYPQLRISPRRLDKIDISFKKKCLQYIFLHKFQWVLKDMNCDVVINLSKQLKKQYEKLLLKSFFRQANSFQIFIVYVTMLFSLFLLHNCQNILLDYQLQSQVCIILHHTFLGIEVTIKTYEILQKKYLLRKNAKDSSTFRSASGSRDERKQQMSKHTLKSFKSTRKIGQSKYGTSSKKFRESKLSFSKGITDSCALQNITSLLKQNLHVQPLPPLKRKKIRAQDLEKMYTEPCENQMSTLDSMKSPQESLGFIGTKKKFIYSNQLSNSLKLLHPKKFNFQLSSKAVKFSQTFYNYEESTPYSLDKTQNLESKIKADSQSVHYLTSGTKHNSDEWKLIIKNIKHKVSDLKCLRQDLRKALVLTEPGNNSDCSPQKQSLYINSAKSKQSTPSEKEEQQSHQNIGQKPVFFQKDSNYSQESLLQEFQGNIMDISKQFLNKVLSTKDSKRLSKANITIDKDSFISSCFSRRSQIINKPKISLHAQWIINHYKE